MGALAAAEEDDEEESSFGFGKAVLAILMMFAVGAVAGFAYFHLSAPQVHTGGNNNQAPSSTPASGTPSPSPSTTPAATTTPHADARPTDAFLPLASASAAPAYVIVVRSLA